MDVPGFLVWPPKKVTLTVKEIFVFLLTGARAPLILAAMAPAVFSYY
jgi:hypothetical protein